MPLSLFLPVEADLFLLPDAPVLVLFETPNDISTQKNYLVRWI